MKKILLICFVSVFVLIPVAWEVHAQKVDRKQIQCQPVYGDYSRSTRWGWYGAKRVVKTPGEAREILEKILAPEQHITVGRIIAKPRFFEAEIIRSGVLIDLVIIDKRTGRIRSVY
jgi:hypothetical protein